MISNVKHTSILTAMHRGSTPKCAFSHPGHRAERAKEGIIFSLLNWWSSEPRRKITCTYVQTYDFWYTYSPPPLEIHRSLPRQEETWFIWLHVSKTLIGLNKMLDTP
jgi:hypothetical protein